MSDTEFEMKKEELARQFKPASPELNSQQRQFMAAYFMLLPGSSEIYGKLLNRGRQKTSGRRRKNSRSD